MVSHALIAALALATSASAKAVYTTPHDKYSSSIGVLGCKIDTNRVAYWPNSIDCDNICVKLTHGSRSVHLLRIDQSGGAYDISYDAWAYLQTGKPAIDDPITGGGVAMEYEEVDASECASLIRTESGGLPLSASNSINYLSSCLDQPDSWVAKNHALYNICDPVCTLGHDEECELDLSVSNQPSCPHTLGLQSILSSAPVYDIEYQSGRTLLGGSGDVVSSDNIVPSDDAVEEDALEDPEEAVGESTVVVPSPTSANVEVAASPKTGGVFIEASETLTAPVETLVVPVETSEIPTVLNTASSPSPTLAEETTTAEIEEPTLVTVLPTLTTSRVETFFANTSTTFFTRSKTSSTSIFSWETDATGSVTTVATPAPTETDSSEGAGAIARAPITAMVAVALLCLVAT